MTAAIEAVALAKRYGSTQALCDLDLEVGAGECFGFLGPNGAGKTTTIRLLLALQRADSGRASVLGLDVAAEAQAVHRRIGYLPGDLALYPHFTGRRQIDWFARARGSHDRRLVDELVERFGVVVDRPVSELSTGNRQKIGLVLAFSHRPELLVLDEPTSGLDPLMQDEFERLVRETVAEGRTVFLSSHELDEVQRLANRVAIIKEGRLVTTDSVERLRAGAPRRVDVEFPTAADPAPFARLDGVSVAAATGRRMRLEVTGPIGPVLGIIAARDPLDVVVRHADLDELFRSYYRTPDGAEVSRAR